ncbi:MAG: HDOD domain-containing protein, partial [Candidatus Dadabacteria bacterium]
DKEAQLIEQEEFLDKLKKALREDGDFPANAQVVAKLKKLISDPNTTAHQLAEVILSEPTLGVRVLNLVNSTLYRRAKPILTISQAVIQIGMGPLAELCSSLVLLQKFMPKAREKSSFAQCLQKLLATSLLSSNIYTKISLAKKSQSKETGYLAGTFLELGLLLLAFYFPALYDSILERSRKKNQPLGKSLKELTGLSQLDISLEVLSALNLPPEYKVQLESLKTTEKDSNLSDLGKALKSAEGLSEALCIAQDKDALDKALTRLAKTTGLSADILTNSLGEVNQQYLDHIQTLQVDLPPFPEFITEYKEEQAEDLEEETEDKNKSLIAAYLDEIKEAVKNKEPTASIITSVLETLAWGLKFDRVLLFFATAQRQSLTGRMALGKEVVGINPREIIIPLNSDVANAVEIEAFLKSKIVFTGRPLLKEGWPLTAFPVGFNNRAIGVIYADKVKGTQELTTNEKAAISVLAELLDQSISQKGGSQF